MSDALVDFASLDTAAAATETPVVETPVETTTVDDSAVETPVVEDGSDGTTGKETETNNADGTEKTPEEQEAFRTAAAARTTSDKALESTPANVRTALKTMRDADPKNAGVVKELHGAYERWNAAKQIFPKGVAEMTEAKAFIDSVGGPEGYQKMQDMINTVTSTDELLYAADPKLWDNVIEDLKANNHPEALGALAPSLLQKLKAHDAEAYYNTVIPITAEAMREIHMDTFVTKLNEAISAKNEKGEIVPDIAKITGLVKGMTDWYTDLDKDAKARTTAPVETAATKALAAREAAFNKRESDAAAADRNKVETSIAEDCEKRNNVLLGKSLGGFLKLPYFKDFPYETKVDLGNGIKERLYATLKADKAYQTQMSAMWKAKTPDRARMIQYHEAKVQSIAQDIVTKTVQGRYPGYAKGGSAAGKAAAIVAKKVTTDKAATQSVASGKPIYVAVRPTNLVREPLTAGGKEYSSSDLVTLQIMGRGFVKTTDGKGFKFITWRR